MTFETMNDASYRQEDGAVILHASAKSDFVVSPITGKAHASAAFLYQRVKGDFVLQAKVSPVSYTHLEQAGTDLIVLHFYKLFKMASAVIKIHRIFNQCLFIDGILTFSCFRAAKQGGSHLIIHILMSAEIEGNMRPTIL